MVLKITQLPGKDGKVCVVPSSMRSDSLKHKLLLSNPDFTTELCDKWASRSMLQGCLGIIEGLLFVRSHLGNQGEGNHANCLKLSAARSNLPESFQISSVVIDVTENDYFYIQN